MTLARAVGLDYGLCVLAITPYYLVFFAVLLALLSARVIRLRRRLDVLLGSGEDDRLLAAIRSQANLTEYVPLALLMLACLELNGGPAWLLHGCGGLLVVGRLIHAWSLPAAVARARVIGMAMTFTTYLVLGIANLAAVLAPGSLTQGAGGSSQMNTPSVPVPTHSSPQNSVRQLQSTTPSQPVGVTHS